MNQPLILFDMNKVLKTYAGELVYTINSTVAKKQHSLLKNNNRQLVLDTVAFLCYNGTYKLIKETKCLH
jgi:hypothetical protein